MSGAGPPPSDGSVIRRSVYQNSNTLVEVLIKSKEPRPRSIAAAASEPAWPAAVPVRKDGRPLSATAQRLPVRPRTGRPLPAWRPAAAHQEAQPSPPRAPAGRGARLAAGRGAGVRGPPARQPPLPPPPTQAEVRARPVHDADEDEGDELAASEAFRTWTMQLNKLVQDIRKRPATAHLRPLLSRLEEAVRVPPVPPPQRRPTGDDLLRTRLEEIQQENEELQSKFQSLSAAMREYQKEQQQQLAGGHGDGVDAADRAGPEARAHRAEHEAELAELRRQLAKYKKYAKELKKTKENLLNTIQTLEESHAAEIKELKADHETQVAQLLAQFTSETEVLASFRADAEAVQRSLALRVREKSELQRTVAEQDAEIKRLAALNQSLHDLALKQLQRLASSELPSLSQLMTKLQPPGPDGAGDGAPRPGWLAAAAAAAAGRDVSLLSLDVTEPLPARPFPHEWADLSLGSLVGSAAAAAAAADSGGQRVPGDGDRRPPSGGGGDPSAGGGGPDSRTQQPWRPPSDGGASRRLFGAGGGAAADQPAGDGGGDRRPSPRQHVSGGVDGADGSRRPPPVGSQTEEEGFQRSLARLNERLSDLQRGVSRAAQVLSP